MITKSRRILCRQLWRWHDHAGGPCARGSGAIAVRKRPWAIMVLSYLPGHALYHFN